MEENVMTNELVNQVAEQVADTTCEELSVLRETLTQPEVPVSSSNVGKNVAFGVGTFVGGVAAGYALDKWVIPKVKEAFKKRKERKAKKKAEKETKKAAKEGTKAEPATEPKKVYDVETMDEADIKIDDLEN